MVRGVGRRRACRCHTSPALMRRGRGRLGPGRDPASRGRGGGAQPRVSCGVCRYCSAGEQSLWTLRHPRVAARAAPSPNSWSYRRPTSILCRSTSPLSRPRPRPLVNMTAWRMLITKAQLCPGERVLIVGAGGGVATAAIQIAKLAGAWRTRVPVVRRRRAGRERLAPIRSSTTVPPMWSPRIMDLTGGEGVDVVVDSVRGASWEASRVVSVKVAAWSPVGRPLPRLRRWTSGSCGANRSVCMARRWRTSMSSTPSWVCWLPGELHPVVDRVFPLSRARMRKSIWSPRANSAKSCWRFDARLADAVRRRLGC